MTLAEALANVDLEVGKTYQVRVRDQFVQVRVVALDQMPLAMPIDSDDTLPDNCLLDLPGPAPTNIIRASRSILSYDRPFEITDTDLIAGDID